MGLEKNESRKRIAETSDDAVLPDTWATLFSHSYGSVIGARTHTPAEQNGNNQSQGYTREETEIRELPRTGEFPSLSQLLRAAANKHIEEDTTTTAEINPDQITDAVENALGDVTERLERIEDELAHIDTEVGESEDVETMVQDIVAELPVMDDGAEFSDDLTPGEQAGDASVLEFCKLSSTPSAWSDYVEEDVTKTRRALSRLIEWYPDVEYISDEERGVRRYYRPSKEL